MSLYSLVFRNVGVFSGLAQQSAAFSTGLESSLGLKKNKQKNGFLFSKSLVSVGQQNQTLSCRGFYWDSRKLKTNYRHISFSKLAEASYDEASRFQERKKSQSLAWVQALADEPVHAEEVVEEFELNPWGRRIRVRGWRGEIWVDIRDWFENPREPGSYLPTKKGICLKLRQWEDLKDLIPQIDEAIDGLQGYVEEYREEKEKWEHEQRENKEQKVIEQSDTILENKH